MIKQDYDDYVKKLKFVRDEAMERYLSNKKRKDKGLDIDYSYENIQIKNTNQMMASIMAEIHAVNANTNQLQIVDNGESIIKISNKNKK
jgi:hypothetical protein